MKFSDADKEKLEALKEKKAQASKDARNERKRHDRLCKKLFGYTVAQVRELLEKEKKLEQFLDDNTTIIK